MQEKLKMECRPFLQRKTNTKLPPSSCFDLAPENRLFEESEEHKAFNEYLLKHIEEMNRWVALPPEQFEEEMQSYERADGEKPNRLMVAAMLQRNVAYISPANPEYTVMLAKKLQDEKDEDERTNLQVCFVGTACISRARYIRSMRNAVHFIRRATGSQEDESLISLTHVGVCLDVDIIHGTMGTDYFSLEP